MASQLQKQTLQEGNGKDYPSKGDQVAMHYTGWLYDANKADNKYRGNQ